MHEFGVQFNSERTCYWLKQAALSDDHCQENYLAQAWCWRVHQALGVTLDVGIATLRNWMMLSITRGHRNCITESFKISTLITGSDERKRWQDEIISCIKMLNTVTGGVGMPYFVPRKLRRQYNIEDLDVLDRDIQQEFLIRQVEKLDEIFVNHRGDGLLHMAASLGNLAALKHLVEKYNPDVNCANQANHETPLHCACRGGHLDCALFLLDRGASPDGSQWAEEMPLYWLCAFAENDIPIIAAKLVAAGATLNKGKGRSWAPPIWADSDNLFSLPVSPLSRAVMMQSIPAVTALLAVGADPIHDLSSRSSACPVVLAAVLTLPRILEMLLLHLSTRNPEIFPQKLITDMEILQIAVEQTATTVDVTSLENRITRHGADYKTAMFETLEILHLRGTKTTVWTNEGSENKARAANTMLARLVSLGRLDIVDSLLQLGHPVHGKPDACPILEATKLNHEPLFRLLVGHGASITMKISSATGVQRSLLQVFAERPSQSRPGLFIPEYLLKMGVAVDPLPDGSQPAFASAVKNQDFALADLLLQHGADINLSYAPQEGAPWVTVLGDLFRNPTDKSVESVKYLLRIDGRVKPGILVLPAIIGAIEDSSSLAPSLPLPDFIVEKQRNLSILHYAAMCVPKTNLESLVMGRMVRYILSVQKYSNADVINLRHPDGTALWLAALFCNLEVVAALLEKKADTGIRVRGFTALAIAQTMVANVVAGLKPEMDRVTKGQILKKYTLIVELLRNAAEQTQETNGFDLVRM
jgi:ankyrin repeat protein